jgi:Holliday junction resolvasome RuvABC DNA-binding subunit
MVDNQEGMFGESDQPDQDKDMIEDAITALHSVGYKKAEAKKVIESLLQERAFNSVEELVRDALSKI